MWKMNELPTPALDKSYLNHCLEDDIPKVITDMFVSFYLFCSQWDLDHHGWYAPLYLHENMCVQVQINFGIYKNDSSKCILTNYKCDINTYHFPLISDLQISVFVRPVVFPVPPVYRYWFPSHSLGNPRCQAYICLHNPVVCSPPQSRPASSQRLGLSAER